MICAAQLLLTLAFVATSTQAGELFADNMNFALSNSDYGRSSNTIIQIYLCIPQAAPSVPIIYLISHNYRLLQLLLS